MCVCCGGGGEAEGGVRGGAEEGESGALGGLRKGRVGALASFLGAPPRQRRDRPRATWG